MAIGSSKQPLSLLLCLLATDIALSYCSCLGSAEALAGFGTHLVSPSCFNFTPNLQHAGQEPTRETNPELDTALRELESMTGLGSVKRELASMVAVAHGNYHHEQRGERIDDLALNRLFVGNPGTGKTTVAKLYGLVLKALRLLSNGEVVYKVGDWCGLFMRTSKELCPRAPLLLGSQSGMCCVFGGTVALVEMSRWQTASDFVGQYVGESQTKTRAIIEMAQGKVLLIDEAYVRPPPYGPPLALALALTNSSQRVVIGAHYRLRGDAQQAVERMYGFGMVDKNGTVHLAVVCVGDAQVRAGR